jgi:hypothetical protein
MTQCVDESPTGQGKESEAAMPEPVCVQWRKRGDRPGEVAEEGWCAIAKQPARLTERERERIGGAVSVYTRCRHFVVLPLGLERRRPTCKECLAAEGEPT